MTPHDTRWERHEWGTEAAGVPIRGGRAPTVTGLGGVAGWGGIYMVGDNAKPTITFSEGFVVSPRR